ncbi:MAG: hypothetical protein RI964_489 [Pseudomonadota bacterium]|jgi:hypothetical protein
MSANRVVHIQTKAVQAPLSPAQKKFNSLIKKIAAQKKTLADWQETIPRCQRDAQEKLEPLRQQLHEQQAKMVELLDQQFTSHKFTPNQAEKIAHIITETCEELISLNQRDDLKALFNKYSVEDFDAVDQASDAMAMDFMKAMFEQELGITMDDEAFDINDPQGTVERLHEKLRQQQAERDAQQTARQTRKKSAKQLAKEAQQAEEATNVSKSIQAIYRQLTSALHPDREPDPVERERKTELMQQVTVAYANKDLLKLLELQLAVEQIDQTKLNNIAADRLKHYNTILTNQLAELQAELELQEMRVRQMLGIAPYEPLYPKRLEIMLKDDIRNVEKTIEMAKIRLRQFQDVKNLKQWLKTYRIPDPNFDAVLQGFTPF